MEIRGLLEGVLAVGVQANGWLSAATKAAHRSLVLPAVCPCWMMALLLWVQGRRGAIGWYMGVEEQCPVLAVVSGM